MIVPPDFDERNSRARYGAQLFQSAFGFDFTDAESDVLSKFKQHGPYLEACGAMDLYAFAVPIKALEDKTIAYLIAGPLILNKRLESQNYARQAEELALDEDELTDVIHEIRVVSFVTIKSILDLLAQIAKDIVDLNIEKRNIHARRFNKEIYPQSVASVAQDMYSTIHLDELLITALDVALNCTGAECGSIMLLDKEKNEFTIKVSKGLDQQKVLAARTRMGEGVSGLAAQENRPLVIKGTEGDSRLKPFLKRPEIKQSAVIPLSIQNRVLGILNVHTKKDAVSIDVGERNIQHLSRLISTAIQSI